MKKTESKSAKGGKKTAGVKEKTAKQTAPVKKTDAVKEKTAGKKKTPAVKKIAGKKKAEGKEKKAEVAKLDEFHYSDGERAMLREKQLELAFGGDRQMLIWLGKAVLGQTPAAAPRGGEDGETVIVLTPDEAVALYGPGGEGKG